MKTESLLPSDRKGWYGEPDVQGQLAGAREELEYVESMLESLGLNEEWKHRQVVLKEQVNSLRVTALRERKRGFDAARKAKPGLIRVAVVSLWSADDLDSDLPAMIGYGSYANNADAGICSSLAFTQRSVFQLFEGAEGVVDLQAAIVAADPRHHSARLILKKPISAADARLTLPMKVEELSPTF
eukprot:gene20549-31646_t